MNNNLRSLRFFLLFSAFVWGVAFVGVIVPWSAAEEILEGLGAGKIPTDPMLDYWLRMASGAFGLVGVLFLVLAIRPARYANIVPWFGWLMICEGVILLTHGLRLGLPPFPFYADASACFVGGIGILATSRKGARSQAESEGT